MKKSLILSWVAVLIITLLMGCTSQSAPSSSQAPPPPSSSETPAPESQPAPETRQETGNYSQDFTIRNDTGYDIYYLYVSASDSDNWEEDLLDRDILPNGEAVKINFARNESRRYWDIKIIDEDGDEFFWYEIDLFSVADITLTFDRNGNPLALFGQGGYSQDFTIVNDTGYDIYYLFISPSDSNNWEEDVLGNDILKNGNSGTIRFSAREARRYWDIKIIDEDADEFFWTEIDLFSISEITLSFDRNGRPIALFD